MRNTGRAVRRRCRCYRGRIVDRETEDEIRRHVLRWIVAVLIRDLSRKTVTVTASPLVKSIFGLIVNVLDPSHDGVGDVAGTARRAHDLEPIACYVDWFAERDGEVRIVRHLRRPFVGVVR